MGDKRIKSVMWKCRWSWHENRTRAEKDQPSAALRLSGLARSGHQRGSPEGDPLGAGIQSLTLEPIQEVEIHGQTFDLVKRRSMMRIMARRMKATTVVA